MAVVVTTVLVTTAVVVTMTGVVDELIVVTAELFVITDVVGGADKHLASIGRNDSNVTTGIANC